MLKFVEVNTMIKYMYFKHYQLKVRPDINIFDRVTGTVSKVYYMLTEVPLNNR